MTLNERITVALALSRQADRQQEADVNRSGKASASAPRHKGGSFAATVLRVIDGDTLIVQGPAEWPEWWRVIAVRLLGIDAPELHDHRPELAAKAQEAEKALAGMVQASGLVLINDVRPDKYGGRLLGTPIVSGKNCCEEMLALGLARVYEGRGLKPW